MPQAIWNGHVIADTSDFEEVEGNVYFPPAALKREFFEDSTHTSVCGWKGTANYYHVVVAGKRNDNAAWYYAAPKPAAANITGYVAFWKGVTIKR
ncbi:MAG TPA: DUF427 domain-containing protein [Sorangium sp.]|nr:DUF427 domain-containing protein [Sorangium sp.]